MLVSGKLFLQLNEIFTNKHRITNDRHVVTLNTNSLCVVHKLQSNGVLPYRICSYRSLKHRGVFC